jgi:Tol biopolymer transport system component
MKRLAHIKRSILSLLLIFCFISSGNWPTVSLAMPWQIARSLAQQGQLGTIVYNKPNDFGNVSGQDVWLINPDGSSDRRIPISPEILPSVHNPVWSRDGRLIAGTGLFPEGLFYGIVVFDPTLSWWRLVAPLGTAFGEEVRIAFSPDGRRLAFVQPGQNFLEYSVISLDGREQTPLGIRPMGEPLRPGIDWSPRQNLLVVPLTSLDPFFVPIGSCGIAPGTALFLVQPITGGIDLAQRDYSKQLTHHCPPDLTMTVDDFYPAFSPDGTKVAFVREMKSVEFSGTVISSIQIVDITSRTERQVISAQDVTLQSLSWSGDGTKLVFEASQSYNGIPTRGGLGIWVIDANGTGLRQVKAGLASSPSWNWAR